MSAKKTQRNSMEKAMDYMKNHPVYNAVVHTLGGIGLGILITYPIAGVHPIRFGLAFLLLAVLGHIFAMFA